MAGRRFTFLARAAGNRASPPQGGQNLLDPGEFHPGPALRAPAGDLQLVEPEPVLVGDVIGPPLPDEGLGRGGVRAARPAASPRSSTGETRNRTISLRGLPVAGRSA